jgi:hypothetical protein
MCHREQQLSAISLLSELNGKALINHIARFEDKKASNKTAQKYNDVKLSIIHLQHVVTPQFYHAVLFQGLHRES